MLQQIIRSISRAILGRVADSNEKLRNSINENAAKTSAFEQQQTQTNAQLWADILDKERRIVDNRLDINKLQEQAISFEKNVDNLVRDLESHKKQIWADVLDKERRIVDNTLRIDALQTKTDEISSNITTVSNSLDSHERRVWSDLADKERRIVDNTLGVQSLQQSVQDIWANVVDKENRIVNNTNSIQTLQQETEQIRSDAYNLGERVSDLSGNFKHMFGDLSNSHYKLEAEVNARFDAITGIIDDTNLDSIREIADRIKAEAEGNQTLRAEVKQADAAINQKIDSLIPVELQNSSQEDWERIVEEIVSQEMNKLGV